MQASDSLTVTMSLVVVVTLVLFFVLLFARFQRNLRKRDKLYYEGLMKSIDEERRRIGQDLHDEANPSIASLRHILYHKGLLTPEITDIINTTAGVIRGAAHKLAQANLRGGIQPAIEAYAHNLESDGLKVHTSFEMADLRISDAATGHIYKIIAELMSNAARHSKGNRIIVTVRSSQRHLDICIEDNGIGFDQKSPDGIGYQSILNRLDILRGTISITSDKGTRISVKIPKSALTNE